MRTDILSIERDK